MKLVVPYVGEIEAVDARLIRLAEFLGISWEPLLLAKTGGLYAEYLERAVPDQRKCFVVNPRVMKKWMGEANPSELASFLASRFPYLLVHSPRPDSFDANVIGAISCGHLRAVQEISHSSQSYEIAPDSEDVCEAFAGLSFGPANSANDRVFSTGTEVPLVRNLISLGGRPFMAAMTREKTKILFLAGGDVVDLNAEVSDASLMAYFSRLLPHTMALRYIFGEECWRPTKHHASIIIDDPLLRPNYGFLNFESLLELMKQHNFHTTIAFIPHNFRRTSPRIAGIFRENTDRFALCFHGNDHTGAEFASTDKALLNTMLRMAENRMSAHHKMTGLDCDRVMVFPQGKFSVEAMTVLKSCNFDSAVNTVPHPEQQPIRLTIGEVAQPAVLRYGGFPLFLRQDSLHTQSADIAFNLFFGKPILIAEHHDVFKHPEYLIEVVSKINAAAPEIHWTNLASALANSILRRRTPDGTFKIRAYSRTVRITNDFGAFKRFLIEWNHFSDGASVEQVLKDGMPYVRFEADDTGMRVSVDLDPGSSQTLSVVHRNAHITLQKLGLQRSARAFLRRRLSEVRDNYLSKNQSVLAVAKALQRSLLG